MGNEWVDCVLGDLLESGDAILQTGPFGTALKADEYSSQGVPLISVREIRKGFVQIEDVTPRVDHSVTTRLPKFVLKTGDIVFARKGGVERNALVTEKENGWFLGSDGIYLRLSDKYDSSYFSYVMRSPNITSWLLKNSEGTTMPSLNQKILSRIPISLPPRFEQTKIADLLSDFDNKITLNRQINQTLEQMAQALFQSWFVDFDPVIDNALDAGLPIPEPLQPRAERRRAVRAAAGFTPLPDAVRRLFPESFVESELGWVPEGWEVLDFGKVSECFDRKRIPLSKKEREAKKPGIYPYYGATSAMDWVNEYIFDDIYLLVGEDGSVIKEDGTPFIQYIWGKSWVNNHAHVLQGRNSISTEHLMIFMAQTDIKAYVTGAVQLKINQKNLNSIPFLKAEETINSEFRKLIMPYFDRIRFLHDEIKSLVKLRDTLLPKLISGELRLDSPEVKQAQAFVENMAGGSRVGKAKLINP